MAVVDALPAAGWPVVESMDAGEVNDLILVRRVVAEIRSADAERAERSRGRDGRE